MVLCAGCVIFRGNGLRKAGSGTERKVIVCCLFEPKWFPVEKDSWAATILKPTSTYSHWRQMREQKEIFLAES